MKTEGLPLRSEAERQQIDLSALDVKSPLWRVYKEKCRRDAHFFIFKSGVLRTKDEHDLLHPTKTLPHEEYLRVLLDFLLVSGRMIQPRNAQWALERGYEMEFLDHLFKTCILFIEKSRQLMATWIVCCYLLWRARSYPHQLILVQSKREDDAANLVFTKEPTMARMSFLESTLPEPLRLVTWPRGGSYGHLYFPNGSHVWAIAEGGSIVRSNTPSVLFSDEAAYQDDFDAAYTAAIPAISGGGQGIFISSANPGSFCDLVEGMAS